MRIDRYRYHCGDLLAGCTVKALAGRGGSGEIYIVADATGQIFAVKVCYASSSMEKEGVVCVRNVAETTGLLKIYQAGDLAGDGSFCYMMQAADNVSDWPNYQPDSLEYRIRQAGHLPATEIFTLIEELLQGVAAIHKAGYVHRDIKPENILFVQGRPCLADFGLLCRVDTEVDVAGTPGYVPAEYPERDKVSCDQDFYALGKVMYVLWSGIDAAEYPALPTQMDLRDFAAVHYCYERACGDNVSRRPKTVDEFRNLMQKAQRRGKNSPRRWLAVVLVVMVLVCGGIVYWWPKAEAAAPALETKWEEQLYQKYTSPETNPLVDEYFDICHAINELDPYSPRTRGQRHLLERRKEEIQNDWRFELYVLDGDLRRHQYAGDKEGALAVQQKIKKLLQNVKNSKNE